MGAWLAMWKHQTCLMCHFTRRFGKPTHHSSLVTKMSGVDSRTSRNLKAHIDLMGLRVDWNVSDSMDGEAAEYMVDKVDSIH